MADAYLKVKDNGALGLALTREETDTSVTELKTQLDADVLKSYNLTISTADRWTTFSSDCDNLTPNRIFLITYNTEIAHLPYSEFRGFIVTLTGVSNATSTGVQIAMRPSTTDVYRRFKWGNTWGAWTNLLDAINNTLTTQASAITALQNAGLNDFESYGLLISSAERWAEFNNDVDNLPVNRIVTTSYSTDVLHLPRSGFNGFYMTFVPAYNTVSVRMQIAVHATTLDMYVRTLWSGSWTAWKALAFSSEVQAMQSDIHTLYYENDLWKVFHTVGVIGDSLASGECASNEGGSTSYHDLYQFSWGQCMARDSGNTYYNFSKGGLTTKTWMTDTDYGYALASQPGKLCDMYIIGLGQNDAGQHMTVGTSADIDFSDPDNNADTFYGNYAKIIQKMQAIAPKAPIFVMSRPTVPASNEYESAIRAMPTLFDNVYLLDMYKHVNDFYNADSLIRKSLRSGHYNAIAYEVISKHIEEEISYVIRTNVDDFLQVEFINTDYSWND